MRLIKQSETLENEVVKPEFYKTITKSFGDGDKIAIDIYLCGNCKQVIERRGYQFCPWCGEMIKWE